MIGDIHDLVINDIKYGMNLSLGAIYEVEQATDMGIIALCIACSNSTAKSSTVINIIKVLHKQYLVNTNKKYTDNIDSKLQQNIIKHGIVQVMVQLAILLNIALMSEKDHDLDEEEDKKK